MLLYIERWLKAPAMLDDGTLVPRGRGTPQGGVISPLLANLFLHYAFDVWLGRGYPGVPFERYADDIICIGDLIGQSSDLGVRLRASDRSAQQATATGWLCRSSNFSLAIGRLSRKVCIGVLP